MWYVLQIISLYMEIFLHIKFKPLEKSIYTNRKKELVETMMSPRDALR